MRWRSSLMAIVVGLGLSIAIPAVTALAALVFIGRNFRFSIGWGRGRAEY
jgi:hypothetical protein